MTEPAEGPSVEGALFLVDGTYTVFRSFYAIRQLTAPDGTPTNGVFGFVNTLRKLVRDHEPGHFAVAFDLEGPTHRDAIFEEYKANRPEPPAELVPQFPLAREACRVLDWPDVSVEGYEADDVLATLAEKAAARGLPVVIVTSDKDLYQLVRDGVVVLNPSKDDRILDEAGVEELFGVAPDRVVDVLALMGDAVDNVPGVPGVGGKTARTLVRRYGGTDAIAERAGLFRELWQARESALEALAGKDEGALGAALAALRGPARRLAELEGELGGPEGEDLVARFGAAADLAEAEAPAVRPLKKALGDLGRKTQPKTWLSIADNDDTLTLSKTLVTVHRDAPVELDLDAMRIGPPHAEAAADLFRALGFRRLTEEMEAEAGPAVIVRAADEMEVRILTTADALDAEIARLSEAPLVAFDTETDGLDARSARLVGVSLAGDEAGGSYLPVGHAEGEQLDWERARPRLEALLGDPAIPKAGQHAKFDRAVLRNAGLVVRGLAFDTLIAAQLIEPGRGVSHKLDHLAERWLGQTLVPYSAVAGSGDDEKTLDLVPIDDVARYAVEDAVVTLRLAAKLREALQENDLLELFETIEMPLVPLLEEMQDAGIRLDADRLAGMSSRLEGRIGKLVEEIHALAGHEFNINSPQQLRTVLFEELGLVPTGRRTQKTRVHSTKQETLEALAEVHPLPGKVLEYRELAKLKSTYVDTLPGLIDARDGRVHGQLHQLGAATGRLSSSDPNLQNIPVRTELGREIREAFVPEDGHAFVSADYSQMELRILAHVSDDPELIGAFERGLDIHRHTAALVGGIAIEDVTPEARARAKAVNFGIIYGMSEFRLAREQGMSRDEARAFIDAYFERYPEVRRYIDGVIEQVQETGEVRTLYGRLRRFPELVRGADAGRRLTRPLREQLLRQAVNTTIQGTGADIVKRAMTGVKERLAEAGLAARLILQVHDELLVEAPEEETERVADVVRAAMEGAARLAVPLSVEVRTASNWAEAH